MSLKGETLSLVIIFSAIIVLLVLIMIVLIVWCRCSGRKRPRNARETTRGEDNQNVPMSDITSVSETVPPNQTNEPVNYEDLVVQHVYRMHQELPPLEPSAPPLLP
ncbi:hypothetical protein ACF0H5_020415 [Mactra antiquata]